MAERQVVATDNGAGATTVAITVAATAAGSFLAVLLGPRSTVTISSVADNQSSAGWTVASLSNPDPVGGNIPAMAYCPSCNAGVTTITVTLSGSAPAIAAAIERDDIVSVLPFDNGTISGNGAIAVTSWSSGNSAVPTGSVVAYGWTNSGAAGLSFTAGTGWTALAGTGLTSGSRTNATDGDQSFFESQTFRTAAAIAATGTSTSATQNTAVALFRLARATGVPKQLPRAAMRLPGGFNGVMRAFFPPIPASIAIATTSHDATGALAADAATLSGTAAHEHASTGALSVGAATIAGTAAHLSLHTSTGALSAGAATVAGTAAHQHAATGVLAAQSATLAGAAAHEHATTGALTADAAVIDGTTVHTAPGVHAASGDLVADAALVSGSAELSPVARNTGIPGHRHRYVAYINGKPYIGDLGYIQSVVQEFARVQAEKAVETAKPPKKPRIIVQPGRKVDNPAVVSRETTLEVQESVRDMYAEAYAIALNRLQQMEDDDEETLLMLL